ncbi:MAG: hypothetical protein GEU75_07815 [Dehalococcoidia bacterium]|nr:hypothetical protein [Dehalococcoidia bacterium]
MIPSPIMSLTSIIVRGLVGLAFTFWVVQVLAVAVFAVPDRYSGSESVVLSLVVVAGGLLPVAFFIYLFRGWMKPGHSGSAVPITGSPPETAASVEAPVELISARELEVLALIAHGDSNKEIAQRLSITVGTVKTHTNNINRKLGTRTRTQAIARARALQLI